MKVLFLAPHPFYQERGTPIAVDLMLRVLSLRGAEIDVVTFHEGCDVRYENATMHRIPSLPFIRGLRPGFSLKKLFCDALMFFSALRLMCLNHYDIVHAVEESVFMALLFKWFYKTPYIYDMDSSLAQQMMEKFKWLEKFEKILNGCERIAIQQARAVLPVCQALGEIAADHQQRNIMVLHDVPIDQNIQRPKFLDLRKTFAISSPIVMYVGNLESYQGIDLLLDSFAVLLAHEQFAHLVIVGGDPQRIQKYREKARKLGIQANVHFLGPQPVEDLGHYLAEAEVLVSPRIKGNNTPMKIYSYLQSGIPVVATNLPTHTQVMDSSVAELVAPTPQSFAEGMRSLLQDQEKRERLGTAAQRLVKDRYSYESFCRKINQLYDWVIAGGNKPLSAGSPSDVSSSDRQSAISFTS